MFCGTERVMACMVEDDEVRHLTFDEIYEKQSQGKTIALHAYGHWKTVSIRKVDKDELSKLKKGRMTQVVLSRPKVVHWLDGEVLTSNFDRPVVTPTGKIVIDDTLAINPVTIWLRDRQHEIAWVYLDSYKRHKYNEFDHLYEVKIVEYDNTPTRCPLHFIELSDGFLVGTDK